MLARVVCVALLASACGARSELEDDGDSGVREAGVRPVGRCRAPRRRPDFNGDGVGDLAIGTSEGARVYLGARAGLSATAANIIALGASSGSAGVSFAGDVNGDGRGDLVVYRRADIPVEPQGPPRHGLAEVHLGTATGVDPRAQAVLQAPAEAPETFPSNVYSAGDLNGDGYDDLVAGSLLSDGVSVFLGSASGINPVAANRVQLGMSTGADASWFAHGLGDFNNDGFDDVAVAGEIEARIFWGGAAGLSMQRSALVESDTRGGVGPYLDGVGDLNGDGCPDAMLFSFSRNDGGMYFIAGGSDEITPVVWAPRMPSGELVRFNGASDFERANDTDGDGIDDVIILGTCLSSTAPCPDRPTRERYLVRGHTDANSPYATVNLSLTGTTVTPVGDLTGDGRTEVAAVAFGSNTARIHTWTASGPSATAAVTLTLPMGVTFTRSVAGTSL